MDTIASRHLDHILCLSFLSLILLSSIDGCKKDESGPNAPRGASFPSVAGNWVGIAVETGGLSMVDTATFAQTVGDSVINGSILITIGPTGACREYVYGKINMRRQIILSGTSIVVIRGPNWYNLDEFTLALTTAGDTISGTYKGVGGGSGTIVLGRR